MLQLSFNFIEQLIIFNNPRLLLVIMKIMKVIVGCKSTKNILNKR